MAHQGAIAPREKKKCLKGAFEKLRKVRVKFLISVRTAAWNNSFATRWIFIKFDICGFFRKPVEKV